MPHQTQLKTLNQLQIYMAKKKNPKGFYAQMAFSFHRLHLLIKTEYDKYLKSELKLAQTQLASNTFSVTMHGWTLLPSQFYLEWVFAEHFLRKVQMCFRGRMISHLSMSTFSIIFISQGENIFLKFYKMLILTNEVQSHFHSWISIFHRMEMDINRKGNLGLKPLVFSIDELQKAPFSNSYNLQTNQIYNKLSS